MVFPPSSKVPESRLMFPLTLMLLPVVRARVPDDEIVRLAKLVRFEPLPVMERDPVPLKLVTWFEVPG